MYVFRFGNACRFAVDVMTLGGFAVPAYCLLDELPSGKIETEKQKGLHNRNSPTCTLSQDGYGDSIIVALLPAIRRQLEDICRTL